MTRRDEEHDARLIAEAKRTHYADWSEIDERKARTPEGRAILHRIKVDLYHMDEYHSDMI